MDLIKTVIGFALHLDKHLGAIIQTYGAWTYSLLFLVIFCETGLVVIPFLPGDSILFAAGAFAAVGSLKVNWLFILLVIAVIVGDNTNYWIGRFIGPKVFHKDEARFLNKKYLDRTHQFYEKHGGKTIIIARFIPIIRTFTPFIAGIGKMAYWRFLAYSITGGISWIFIFIFGGYYFGNIPLIKQNFSLVIFVIIIISIMPAIIEFLRQRRKNFHNPQQIPKETK